MTETTPREAAAPSSCKTGWRAPCLYRLASSAARDSKIAPWIKQIHNPDGSITLVFIDETLGS
jgi:hypothetical protein